MSDLIGHLCWYTIVTPEGAPTLDVTIETLEEWFGELGLDKGFLPKAFRAGDAFRSATTDRVAEYTSDDGLRYRLLIVEHASKPELITRHVMRQGLVHGSATTLAATITYYRPRRNNAGRIRGTDDVKTRLHANYRGVDRTQVNEFIAACLEAYDAKRHDMTPHKIRTVLRNYLADIGAVPIRPGLGIYFIPPDAHQTATALRDFVAKCGDGCRMRLVPLVDDPDMQEMVREAVDLEVDELAQQTLQSIAEWRDDNSGRLPTPLLLAAWRDKSQRLQDLVLSYGELHDWAFPQAADGLEELRSVTDDLTRAIARSVRKGG